MDAFIVGREPGELHEPYSGSKLLFAGQLADGVEIVGGSYQHSTFANVSFLNAKIKKTTFADCAFIGCYFRKADISGSAFVGCRFIDCNFSHIAIGTSDFRYAQFSGSYPAYGELRYSSPSEPNLRRELFSSLARVAEQCGDSRESRRYRIASIDAHKEDLWAAVRGSSRWYKDHYDLFARIGAASSLVWHAVNRLLWRHGESAWRLFLVALVAILIVFPVVYLFISNGFSNGGKPINFDDTLWLSVSNFFSIDRVSSIVPDSLAAKLFSSFEALLGLVFGGMYVTLLVKSLLRR